MRHVRVQRQSLVHREAAGQEGIDVLGLVQRYQGLGSAARHQIAESEQHESSMHARHEVGFSLVTTFWRNEHSR
jgi:hypothetical protein